MTFSPQFLDELRARAGLADVIARRVRLARKGREHLGLCPFHKEKTPSFTVNEDKGFYHCFGCGAHGSVIDFVMATEGLSFPEAVERLAADAGMEVPSDSPEERERARQRQTLYDVMEAACAFFEKALRMPEGEAARAYLMARGVDLAAAQRFRLGFAPARGDALKAALARDGVGEDRLIAAGLVRRPDDGRATFDYFRGRVTFPIGDRRGRVIAFGARTLGTAEPKYLNSPETPLFHKGRVLYGLAQAAARARESGRLIVAEGYMDVIALSLAGLAEAVAPLGTALTEEQMRELWRVVREPVLCFDGDAAGGRAAAAAAVRALPLLRPGFGLRIALLPAGEDPDSLIRHHGVGAIEAALTAAQPLSEALWRLEAGPRGAPATPEARAALQKRLEEHALRIAEPTLRAHFLRAFKDRLWPSGEARRRGPRAPAADGVVRVAVTRGRVEPRRDNERTLAAIAVNHPELFDEFEEPLGSLEFAGAGLEALRQDIIAILAGHSMDAAELDVALRARGHAATLDGLFGDPLIACNRLIGTGVSREAVRELWNDILDYLRSVRAAAEEGGGPLDEGEYAEHARILARLDNPDRA